MMFLIGSRALHFYSPLVDRVPADWDILTKHAAPSFIENTEFYLKDDPENKTNCEIFNYCLSKIDSLKKINTPAGSCYVAPIEILKVLKLASENELNKFKHEFDLKFYLKDVALSSELFDLSQRRKKEIQKRVKSQKDNFFNKYQVERFIDHDEIHLAINENPVFLKAIKNDGITICPLKFKSLTMKEKIEIIREECFVLAMERFFIYNYKQNPASLYSLAKTFQITNSSTDPMVYWLQKLAVKGALKDHPDWLAEWTGSNYLEILKNMDEWWESCFHKLSEDFWSKIVK